MMPGGLNETMASLLGLYLVLGAAVIAGVALIVRAWEKVGHLVPVAAGLVTSELLGGFLLWRSGAPFLLVVAVLLSVSMLARVQGKQLERWHR